MAKSITVSNKPWSDFKQSDYTLEQWYAACLVHLGQGPPTSKSDCKLPVREPDGTLNRNGVHAAAGALAGARGGVDLPPEARAAAIKKIISLYASMGEAAPESMTGVMHADVESFLASFGITAPSEVDKFLAHFGIKGMKWGVHRDPSGTHGGGGDSQGAKSPYSKRQDKKIPPGSIRQSVGPGGKKVFLMKQNDGSWRETYFSEDQRKLMKAEGKPAHELSNAELRAVTERKRQLDEYNRMFNPTPQQKTELQTKVERLQLEKQYRDLQAALTPPKVNHVKTFTNSVSKGFNAFRAVDKVLGGNLSKGISRRLGLEPPLSTVQKLKARNEFLAAHKKNVELTADLARLADLHSATLDPPSLAPKRFRKSAGRHRQLRVGETLLQVPN